MKKGELIAVILLVILAAGIILSSYFPSPKKPEISGKAIVEGKTVFPGVCYKPVGPKESAIFPGESFGFFETWDEGAQKCEEKGIELWGKNKDYCKARCEKQCKERSFVNRIFRSTANCISVHCWIKGDAEGDWVKNCLDALTRAQLSEYYFQHKSDIKEPIPSDYAPEESYEGPPIEDTGSHELGDESSSSQKDIGDFRTIKYAYYKFNCLDTTELCTQDVDEDTYCPIKFDVPPHDLEIICHFNWDAWDPEHPETSYPDCNDDPVGNPDECWTFPDINGGQPIPPEERTLKKYIEEGLADKIKCDEWQYRKCAKCGYYTESFFIDKDNDGWTTKEIIDDLNKDLDEREYTYCVKSSHPGWLPEGWMPYHEFKANSIQKLMEKKLNLNNAEIIFTEGVLQKADCSDDPLKDEHAAQRSNAENEICDGIDQDCSCSSEYYLNIVSTLRLTQEEIELHNKWCADQILIEGEGLGLFELAKIDKIQTPGVVGPTMGNMVYLCKGGEWVAITEEEATVGKYIITEGARKEVTMDLFIFEVYKIVLGENEVGGWGISIHLRNPFGVEVEVGIHKIKLTAPLFVSTSFPLSKLDLENFKTSLTYREGLSIGFGYTLLLHNGFYFRPLAAGRFWWNIIKKPFQWAGITGKAVISAAETQEIYHGLIHVQKTTYEYPEETQSTGTYDPYRDYGPGEEPYEPGGGYDQYTELPPIVKQEEYDVELPYNWTIGSVVNVSVFVDATLKEANLTLDINETES